jgi:RNA-directed DNA polymerase
MVWICHSLFPINGGQKFPNQGPFLLVSILKNLACPLRSCLYKVGRRTENKRLRKAVGKVKEWLRTNRNKMLLKDIRKRVSQMLTGHYSYYGVSGNFRKIKEYHHLIERLLFKWLNRRSQKRSFNWETYSIYERKFPLPKPKIYHKLY